MWRRLPITLITLLLIIIGPDARAQVQPVPTTDPASFGASALPGTGGPVDYIRSSRLGITFISSAQDHADDTRYRAALRLGAGWNRWPLYWDDVETAPGRFDWAAYDRVVLDDLEKRLRINAILLNSPDFYRDGEIMRGLYAPVFMEGGDNPAAGGALNPDNVWANFVYEAVQRYKPGGTLAQEHGLSAGQGIRVWEVWNEPDLPQFWTGSIRDYARLLKVAYLAIKQADPDAQVMFGGLLYNTPENWLARVLAIYINDPLAAANDYYMDLVAIHNYGYPWRTGWLVHYARQTLIAYEIDRPIWVTETGVNVWDDYPGPVWASVPQERLARATAQQQAWFIVQSAAYAWARGADVVFYHQLYDDCGDQPAGTTFPPHNGDFCAEGRLCFGDAFGIYRNTSDSICYNQHPQGGSARPVAAGYRLLAETLGAGTLTNPVLQDRREDGATLIRFDRPETNERITVIWNRLFVTSTVAVEASASAALRHTIGAAPEQIAAQSGIYSLRLSPAQPDNMPQLEPGDASAIGGPPVILIERLSGDLIPPTPAPAMPSPPAPAFPTITPSPAPPIIPTSGPLIPPMGAVPNPNTAASGPDTTPPAVDVVPLPPTTPTTFTVQWRGSDASGIESFTVWVQVDGGDWQPWLETDRTSAVYTGISGTTVSFALWAVDGAGNWSGSSELIAEATTRIE